jgi:hypothetical protein
MEYIYYRIVYLIVIFIDFIDDGIDDITIVIPTICQCVKNIVIENPFIF